MPKIDGNFRIVRMGTVIVFEPEPEGEQLYYTTDSGARYLITLPGAAVDPGTTVDLDRIVLEPV
jgi:hypothetical protein